MSLSIGDVFRLVNPNVPSVIRHPHIVVGITVERKIHYVYVTSEKDFMRRLCKRAEGKRDCDHLNTFVETDPTECSELDHASCINANLNFSTEEYSLTRMTTYKLCKGVKADEVLMRKLAVALLSTKTAPPILKEMLIKYLASINPPTISPNLQ